MARNYDLKDLEYWNERILEKVREFGLNCYPQEFELCDHTHMLGYMAYHGLPAHYPHWSYGKAYERLKTLYAHGATGLPYEMVINCDPCLAYLMRDNSLCLQILTMAHVYAHNDFFANNFTFRTTDARNIVAASKTRADRVRHYFEDPSIGQERVEAVLDAAHALSLHCRRNRAIRKLSSEEQQERAVAAASGSDDPFRRIHKPREYVAPDLNKIPLEPEEDLLLFIRDHNPRLAEWEKDALAIVDAEAGYLIPQIETKIMNEGWATLWHWEIMNSLGLPSELHLEFLVRHNQVVRPVEGDINPYHLGLKAWQDIRRRTDEPTPEEIESFGKPSKCGRDKQFEVREVDRDVSFLRRFLTQSLAEELGLFEYAPQGGEFLVTKVAKGKEWEEVKVALLRSVGMGGVPVIRIIDADYGRSGTLSLRHEHEGRDLDLEYAQHTLAHAHRLWGRPVVLETSIEGRTRHLRYEQEGFQVRDAA